MFSRYTLFSVIALSFILSFSCLFGAEEKYRYDYSDPKSIVAAASKMVFQSDYEEMLKITEMSEKKRAMEIVNSLVSNEVSREDLQKEAEKILGFEILGIEYVTNGNENKLAVVQTKWLMKAETVLPKPHSNARDITLPDTSNDSGSQRTVKTTTVVFVDYLLKQFNGKWKIVSKRSR